MGTTSLGEPIVARAQITNRATTSHGEPIVARTQITNRRVTTTHGNPIVARTQINRTTTSHGEPIVARIQTQPNRATTTYGEPIVARTPSGQTTLDGTPIVERTQKNSTGTLSTVCRQIQLHFYNSILSSTGTLSTACRRFNTFVSLQHLRASPPPPPQLQRAREHEAGPSSKASSTKPENKLDKRSSCKIAPTSFLFTEKWRYSIVLFRWRMSGDYTVYNSGLNLFV